MLYNSSTSKEYTSFIVSGQQKITEDSGFIVSALNKNYSIPRLNNRHFNK